MRKLKLFTYGLCALMLVSCQTLKQQGAAIGAGGGAVLGGILGNIIGKDTKATAIGAAIGGAVGAGAGAIIGNHMDKVRAETASAVQNARVEEVTDANGLKMVKVTFDSGILFAKNKADLNAQSKQDLQKFSQVLKNNADCYVDVYGHTDSTGTDAINNPLSERRAESVVSYLKSLGVSAAQFKNVIGKGSTDPVADNSTKEGQQLNRRVEVYLYASPEMIQNAEAGTL